MPTRVHESPSGLRRLLLMAAVVILLLTLTPNSGPTKDIPTLCLLCGSFGTADFLVNVLMFVPLGYLTARVLKNVSGALIVVVASTIAIELLQNLIPGRHPTLGDVAANTLGGCLGIWLVHVHAHRQAPWRHRGARAAARAAPFVLAAALVFTVVLFQPALPESTYYGQWTADLGQFAQYAGQACDVRVGSVALPGHRLDATETRAVHRIVRGAPLTVNFLAGPPTTDLAPVFSVFDAHQVEVLVLGVDSDAIVVRMRRLSETLGLHAPAVRFEHLHPAEGTESTLRLTRTAGSLCIRMAGTDSCSAEANPARGWRLFAGISIPDWASGLLDVLWLALFGFLAVYFASRSHDTSPGWVWLTPWFMPVVAYGALWLIFQGDPTWVPGFAGLVAGSVSAAAFH